jgi:hypothetical protein
MKKIFLPFLLAATLNGFAQKISNKLNFQKGQKLEIVTNMNMTTEMVMGETTGSTTTTEVYDVKEVTPTGATIEKSTKNMKLTFSLMGQEKSFDSDKPEDLKGDLGEPLKKILYTKAEFTVDETGKITAVKADESKKKKEEAGQNMMGMFMSQMNMGSAPPKVGTASFFKIMPDYEVSKGDSWSDTTSANGNNSKSTYTVKEITEADVLLDYISSGDFTTKQEMMGMSMESKGTIKMNGTITIDRKTGLMKQKTSTNTTETSTNVSGQAMASTSKITTVTTVKTL